MIYFDNASTTKIDPKVKEVIIDAYDSFWGNPSSLHSLGFEAEKEINKRRKQVAEVINVNQNSVYFAPSGTIINNAVLNSFDKEGKNIVLSCIEHSSNYYKSTHLNCEVRYVGVDKDGYIDKDDLVKKIDENTVLVSIMHVNNELGSINDINELAKISKEVNPNLLFHSDGVQAFNKIPVSMKDIDFYTISAHKIHGPKGIAALYIRDINTFTSLYYGGSQEKKVFCGTENVQAILGFGEATKLDNKYENVSEINKYLREEIEKIDGAIITSPKDNVSPYILNACFEGIGAEIMLHYLEMEKVFVSTGSACNKGDKSRVIEAIGLDQKYSNGCIRISLSKDSTIEEAKDFVKILKEKLEIIRGIIGWDIY